MMNRSDEKLIQYARKPSEGPRLVVIGGGTGLSTLLRGLKLYTENLTAIVTVADNGGSSGMLREDLGILPPGDIRNCILALADAEPLMSDLFNYRFIDGRLKGQNFGNLFIAAMNEISANFYDAVRNVSKVLAVKGRVLPVSLQNIQIGARLHDGTTVFGESEIGHRQANYSNAIEKIFMEPDNARALPEAVESLLSAEAIILGPGSLYTSIIPNLLFNDITKAVIKSKATRIYVSNLMTQPAETLGYDAADHLRAVINHMGRQDASGAVDFCIANNAWPDQTMIARYRLENAIPVAVNRPALASLDVKLVEEPLACVNNGVIRHDHMLLARTILRLLIESGNTEKRF